MENIFTDEINAITAYLENKYGEKFTIDKLVSDDGNPEKLPIPS